VNSFIAISCRSLSYRLRWFSLRLILNPRLGYTIGMYGNFGVNPNLDTLPCDFGFMRKKLRILQGSNEDYWHRNAEYARKDQDELFRTVIVVGYYPLVPSTTSVLGSGNSRCLQGNYHTHSGNPFRGMSQKTFGRRYTHCVNRAHAGEVILRVCSGRDSDPLTLSTHSEEREQFRETVDHRVLVILPSFRSFRLERSLFHCCTARACAAEWPPPPQPND
jgi:hypothetical protein